MHNPSKMNQLPIAYALKGFSMTTETLRKMIDMVLNECKRNNIKVVCICTDGQWAKNCIWSADNSPLTQIQYQKDIMNLYCKHNKQMLISTLEDFSSVQKTSLDQISQNPFNRDKTVCIGNLQVTISRKLNGHKHIDVWIRGHPKYRIPMVQFIKSTKVKSAWALKGNKNSHSDKSIVSEDVIDVLSLIPPHILNDTRENNNLDPHEDDMDNEENNSGTANEVIPDDRPTTNNQHSILDEIVNRLLQMKNASKWRKLKLNSASLYHDHLRNAQSIASSFTVLELDMIGEVFAEFTHYKMSFKKSDHRCVKVNELSKHFTDKSEILPKLHKNPTCKTLYSIAKSVLVSSKYPKEVLVAAVAKTHHVHHFQEWENKATVPLHFKIKGTNIKHDAYCYPEKSAERHDLEPKVLDPTHILMNMCVHCTKRNLDDCLAKDFLHISKWNNDILLRAVVTDLIDKQSASIALKFFLEEVEKAMEKFEEEDIEN